MDILGIWKKFNQWPGGRLLFRRLIAWKIPYTGSISPRVVDLQSGFARVTMQDRRKVRNHLDSLHAIALMNLAEFTTGLAIITAVPPASRTILKSLSIEYLKKARGQMTAEAEQASIATNARQEFFVEARIRNDVGEIVAVAKAQWLVGPVK